MTPEEEKQKLEQEALLKFGKSLDELEEDELQALYRSYKAERDLLRADYQRGQELEGQRVQGRQSGGIYRASGLGELAGTLAQNYAGANIRKDAEQGLGDLAGQEAMGRRAGGEVAAGRLSRMLRAMGGAGGASAQPAAAGATQPPQEPQGPRPPLRAAANPPARSQGPTAPPETLMKSAEGLTQGGNIIGEAPMMLSPAEREKWRRRRQAQWLRGL